MLQFAFVTAEHKPRVLHTLLVYLTIRFSYKFYRMADESTILCITNRKEKIPAFYTERVLKIIPFAFGECMITVAFIEFLAENFRTKFCKEMLAEK
jgi:uncharacterized protein involved in cysteine biosynthesis